MINFVRQSKLKWKKKLKKILVVHKKFSKKNFPSSELNHVIKVFNFDDAN